VPVVTKFEEIAELLRGRRVAVLSGAGISTDSGIPDYRGPGTRARTRSPVQFRQFIDSPSHRQRYWARSAVGWPKFRATRPNPAHRALVELESDGAILGLITQNVDGLHHQAGSKRVVELHGALAEVRCLGCATMLPRDTFQQRLLKANPGWDSETAPSAPDGDADLEDPRIAAFAVPSCEACDGVLKPNVVFFGESVPGDVVAAAWALYEECEVLLVVGSSLTVYSGYRFVRRATQDGKPTVLINIGESRGDEEATIRWSAPLGETLPQLASALLAR
jgi:NAD-dependent deacetylase sirtuin 4